MIFWPKKEEQMNRNEAVRHKSRSSFGVINLDNRVVYKRAFYPFLFLFCVTSRTNPNLENIVQGYHDAKRMHNFSQGSIGYRALHLLMLNLGPTDQISPDDNISFNVNLCQMSLISNHATCRP